MGHVCRTVIYLKDMADFGLVNRMYEKFFNEDSALDIVFPARSTIQVASLPLGALVEIEAIASL